MPPRRSHKKSRNGCQECKRRHIKCNEQYPCSNCSSHGITCSFIAPVNLSSRQSPSISQSSSTRLGTATPTPGLLNKDQPSLLSTPDTAKSSNAALFDLLSDTLHDVPTIQKENWVRDLELMHHFCTVTCNTLAMREDMRYTWRVVVPVEGYENEFVMHGILAVSALHRAYLFPSRKPLYLECSDYHQACGLRMFRAIISSSMKRENWQAIFCFASMVVIWVCGLPVRSADFRLPCPISNTVELFSVIRGIRAILEPFTEPLRNSKLAPFVHGAFAHPINLLPSSADESLLPRDIFTQIDNLRKFVEGSSLEQDEQEDYLTAINFMKVTAEHLVTAGLHIEIGMSLLWPYMLPQRVMLAIQERQPLGLILLAHFCVIFHLFDGLWFFRGWARQVLAEIVRCMPSSYATWLGWPREHILNPT